jgi:hypothetical protein
VPKIKEIYCIRLHPQLCNKKQAPTLLKMDVEGFEYDSFAKHNSIIRLVFLARTNLDGSSLGFEDGGLAVYVKNTYNSRTCLILWCVV